MDEHGKEEEMDEHGNEEQIEEQEIEETAAIGPGRRRRVDWNKQLQQYRLKSKELLDKDNKIKPATSSVYNDLSASLSGMSVKSIHLTVTRRANEIFGNDVIVCEDKSKKNIESSSDLMDDFESMTFDGTLISINIDSKFSDALQIVEANSKFGNRIYRTLKEGWPDTLNKIIIDATQRKCVLAFKRTTVVGEEFTAYAECKGCFSSFKIKTSRKKTVLGLEITEGDGPPCSGQALTKKRRLTSARAKTFIPALKSNTVHNVHTDLVNKLPDDPDQFQQDYVSEKQLSNIKHRYISDKKTTINELRNMKYQHEFVNIIKEIGTDPFFILFWSPLQEFVYSQIAKRNGVLDISFDATGGVVSNFGLIADLESRIDLPHIFFYMICVKNLPGKSVPVAQMLSAQQDTIKINYFLDRFLEGFACPDAVTIDDSKALQKSCANKFADCKNIAEYISKCFAVLNSSPSEKEIAIAKLPKCHIKLDTSHFVKNLHKADVFKSLGKEARYFYLCVIGGLMQMKSYEEIKGIVKHLLVLANYPVEGTLDDGSVVPTYESRINLQRFVRSHDPSHFMQNENDNEEKTSDLDWCIANNLNDIQWFSDMLSEIEQATESINCSPANLTSNTTTNHYNCAKFNKYLCELMQRLPLWGSVMSPYFKPTKSTSSDIESQFNIIKNNTFKHHKLPVSAPVFVKIMIEEINAAAKLCDMSMRKEDGQSKMEIDPKVNEQTDIEMTENECVVTEDKQEEKLYENWCGKGMPDSAQTKNRVVRSSRSILNTQALSESYTFTKIGMLVGTHYKKTRNSIFVQHTTVFDSVFHIVLCYLADNEQLRQTTLQKIKNSNVKNFIKKFFEKGVTQEVLLQRTTLLEPVGIDVIDQMRVLDCSKLDVEEVMQRYITHVFRSARITSQCKCKRREQNIDFLKIDQALLDRMQTHQNVDFSSSTVCQKCQINESTTYEFKDIVFFCGRLNVAWNELPKVVIMQDKAYILGAFIEQINEKYSTAHIMRPNRKWYTFDTSQRIRSFVIKEDPMNIHLLCFVLPSIMYGNQMILSDEIMYGTFVLKNFHTCADGDQSIYLPNSCAVDSILHGLMCLYIDIPKLFEEAPENNEIMKLLSAYAKHDIHNVYVLRSRILRNSVPTMTTIMKDGTIRIDCYTNIKFILDKVFCSTFPSVTIYCICGDEESRAEFPTLDVNYEELTKRGLSEINKCIALPKRVCGKCNSSISNYKLGNILFLDIQPLSVPDQNINIEDIPHAIGSLESRINVQNESFVLKGIIEHDRGRAHYIVKCLRRDNQWYTFDDLKTIPDKSGTQARPHILIFAKE